MSSERNDIDNTTKFLYAFTQNLLNIDSSIRWVGITDQHGNIINERDRQGQTISYCRRKSSVGN
jgi:hypothetical protein